MNANNDLRMLARGKGVPLWAIAERLGCSDQKLLRDWRHELSETEKDCIRLIISELSTGGNVSDKNANH